MIVQQPQISLITVLSFVIISIAGESLAYPISTNDVKRVAASVQGVSMKAVQIKQEYENNLKIIQEIQNGGYAAAAGDLFGKIQNGDYDRFGDNIKNAREDIYNGTHSAKKVDERKKKLEAERLEAEKKALAEEQEARANATANAKAAHKKANKSFFGRAYDWIKGNRLATDAALATVNTIEDGGKLSDIVSSSTKSVGAAVGGNDGAEISSLGGVVSAGINIGTDAADGHMNVGEVLVRTATDGNLSGNVIGAVAAEEGRRNERQAEIDAQNEAAMNETHQRLMEGIGNQGIPTAGVPSLPTSGETPASLTPPPPTSFKPGSSSEAQDAAILGATPNGQ